MNDEEILRVVCRYSAPNSSEMLNVHWYQYSGAGDTDADVLNSVGVFFTGEWGADWVNFAGNDFDFDEVELDVINLDGTVKRNIGSDPIGLTGSVGGDMEPSGVAALLVADTDTPKQRGRKYLAGLSVGDVVDGLITATRLATLALLVVEYLDDIFNGISGTLTPGVLSKPLVAFKPFISSGAITDVPAYQRRRKPNVGS